MAVRLSLNTHTHKYISLKLSQSTGLSQCYLCTFVTNEKKNSKARIFTCPLGMCVCMCPSECLYQDPVLERNHDGTLRVVEVPVE